MDRRNADHQSVVVRAARPLFPDADIEALLPTVAEILRSGRLILGAHTERFEASFATYVGVAHAVAVSSCTAALQIVLRYFDIAEREVVVPTNNFVGVVSAVLYEGGKPVLADMDPHTFCLDTNDALERMTPRTAGLIAVDIAGLVYPDIEQLQTLCRRKGLFLIEDASHAHGAAIGDRKAGAFGDAACFSFYPTKTITTGVGGMLTTDNAELAVFARSVRHHGVGRSLEEIVNLGNDWCMSEIHAAVGHSQLQRLDQFVEHRNCLVREYRRTLADADWLTIPTYPASARHAYYKLPVLLDGGIDRNELRRMLAVEYGIENGAIYDPPCHLQPVFRERLGLGPGDYPRAEQTLARQLCPPVHAAMTLDDVRVASGAMRDAVGRLT